jgi:hypothetical protein
MHRPPHPVPGPPLSLRDRPLARPMLTVIRGGGDTGIGLGALHVVALIEHENAGHCGERAEAGCSDISSTERAAIARTRVCDQA